MPAVQLSERDYSDKSGVVERFDREKGFGVIRAFMPIEVPGGESSELTAHLSDVVSDSASGGIEPGQKVFFQVKHTGSCLEAISIRPIPTLSGEIKWYDDEKGFGFITSDTPIESEPGKFETEVFLHFSELFCLGERRPLEEGERVTFGLMRTAKGIGATAVTAAAFTGQVNWYDNVKGRGIIRLDIPIESALGSIVTDVSLGSSEVEYRHLNGGERVTFGLLRHPDDPDVLMVTCVTVLEGSNALVESSALTGQVTWYDNEKRIGIITSEVPIETDPGKFVTDIALLPLGMESRYINGGERVTFDLMRHLDAPDGIIAMRVTTLE
jgi:CspA family cold shock protein